MALKKHGYKPHGWRIQAQRAEKRLGGSLVIAHGAATSGKGNRRL